VRRGIALAQVTQEVLNGSADDGVSSAHTLSRLRNIGVILNEAALQAERRISFPSISCHLRSLRPLVKTRAFGMTPHRVHKYQTDPLPDFALG
jgi:hypothetical protein